MRAIIKEELDKLQLVKRLNYVLKQGFKLRCKDSSEEFIAYPHAIGFFNFTATVDTTVRCNILFEGKAPCPHGVEEFSDENIGPLKDLLEKLGLKVNIRYVIAVFGPVLHHGQPLLQYWFNSLNDLSERLAHSSTICEPEKVLVR
jgi:hypothetical protein